MVIHSAARVGVGTSAEFERDNVTATRNLAAALDGRRLLHLSTVQVYGTRSLVDAEESCPVDPGADPYSVTKAKASVSIGRMTRCSASELLSREGRSL